MNIVGREWVTIQAHSHRVDMTINPDKFWKAWRRAHGFCSSELEPCNDCLLDILFYASFPYSTHDKWRYAMFAIEAHPGFAQEYLFVFAVASGSTQAEFWMTFETRFRITSGVLLLFMIELGFRVISCSYNSYSAMSSIIVKWVTKQIAVNILFANCFIAESHPRTSPGR